MIICGVVGVVFFVCESEGRPVGFGVFFFVLLLRWREASTPRGGSTQYHEKDKKQPIFSLQKCSAPKGTLHF
jgi:hypothetical protein